jgi:hypothetical protein
MFVLLNCTPSVERYKNKARKALQNEDSQKAREYLQKAFESSLDREFIPLGRWHSYSNLYSSVSRNRLILSENQPSRLKSYFTVYDFAKSNDWKRRVKGYINTVSMSPNGQYGLLHISSENNKCYFELWDLSAKDMISLNQEIPCGQTGGISDDGKIVFIGLNKFVNLLDINTGVLQENFIQKLPPTPSKNIPALGLFQFSHNNKLFFLTGSFGIYHLYIEDDRQLRLISNDASAGKIYFFPGGNSPGVIVGGASDHQVVFYSPGSFKPELYFPVRYWKDAVFIKPGEYFFIEEDRLVEVKDGIENKLPFWGVRLFADAAGRVYLLSPLGHLITYNHTDPGEDSKAIFQMGWEIK